MYQKCIEGKKKKKYSKLAEKKMIDKKWLDTLVPNGTPLSENAWRFFSIAAHCTKSFLGVAKDSISSAQLQ